MDLAISLTQPFFFHGHFEIKSLENETFGATSLFLTYRSTERFKKFSRENVLFFPSKDFSEFNDLNSAVDSFNYGEIMLIILQNLYPNFGV